jgi:hypothetical protein
MQKMIREDEHVNIIKAAATTHFKTVQQTAHTGRHYWTLLAQIWTGDLSDIVYFQLPMLMKEKICMNNEKHKVFSVFKCHGDL